MLQNTDIATLKKLAHKYLNIDDYHQPEFVSNLIDTVNDENLSREEAIIEVANQIFEELGDVSKRVDEAREEGYQDGYDEATSDDEFSLEDAKAESYNDGVDAGYKKAQREFQAQKEGQN